MIAEEDLTPASVARIDELRIMFTENFRSEIQAADWPAVKREFLAPSSDIREIVVVSEGEDMAGVATVLSWEPFLDLELGCIHFEPASSVARRLGREPRVPSIGFELPHHPRAAHLLRLLRGEGWALPWEQMRTP